MTDADRELLEAVGIRVRQRREQLGLTQAALAKRTAGGVDARTIMRTENAENWPTVLRLTAIANALGCSIDALLGREREASFSIYPTLQEHRRPESTAEQLERQDLEIAALQEALGKLATRLADMLEHPELLAFAPRSSGTRRPPS